MTAISLTIIDSSNDYRVERACLNDGEILAIGRNDRTNDISVREQFVSENHGVIVCDGGRCYYRDINKSNGSYVNSFNHMERLKNTDRQILLNDGSTIRIGHPLNTLRQVLIVFSYSDEETVPAWVEVGNSPVSIGRNSNCNIVLPMPNVSRHHCTVYREGNKTFIRDDKSLNGVIVNGERINGTAPLHDKDIIQILGARLIFSGNRIYYSKSRRGISIHARNINKWVGTGKNRKQILKDVNGEYTSRFLEIFESFEQQLNGENIPNLNRELDFCGIVITRAALNKPDNGKMDFVLTGPRSAQFYLTTGERYAKIMMASNVAENWSSDTSVKEYFAGKYGTDLDYNAAYPKADSAVKMPAAIRDVHRGFHYTQLGYNEIGLDAADNIISRVFGKKNGKGAPEKVELVMEDGLTDISGRTTEIPIDKYVPFAVKVFPASMQNDIEIKCSENVIYDSKGLMITGDGTENSVNGSIEVTVNGATEIMKIIGVQSSAN